jgi:Fe-S cluster assembly iron-binding protein IscA
MSQGPQVPESAGVRIAADDVGFELMLVAEPAPGDALIDDGGTRIFIEPQAAELLDEQTLDATLENGEVNFFLASPEATTSPDGVQAQARHDTVLGEAPPQ